MDEWVKKKNIFISESVHDGTLYISIIPILNLQKITDNSLKLDYLSGVFKLVHIYIIIYKCVFTKNHL